MISLICFMLWPFSNTLIQVSVVKITPLPIKHSYFFTKLFAVEICKLFLLTKMWACQITCHVCLRALRASRAYIPFLSMCLTCSHATLAFIFYVPSLFYVSYVPSFFYLPYVPPYFRCFKCLHLFTCLRCFKCFQFLIFHVFYKRWKNPKTTATSCNKQEQGRVSQK